MAQRWWRRRIITKTVTNNNPVGPWRGAISSLTKQRVGPYGLAAGNFSSGWRTIVRIIHVDALAIVREAPHNDPMIRRAAVISAECWAIYQCYYWFALSSRVFHGLHLS